MTEATERAVLAGGCFWGVEDLVRNLPGVISTRVGYTGGDVPDATYRNHGTHAEGIEITFDPSVTSYRDLLEFFFQIHDPTTKNRQGGDVGMSYRSAIYYTSDEQRRIAEGRSPTSTRQGRGRARSSPRWSRQGHSGRPSQSTRTTCRSTRTATRATTSGRTGSCPAATPCRSAAGSDSGRCRAVPGQLSVGSVSFTGTGREPDHSAVDPVAGLATRDAMTLASSAAVPGRSGVSTTASTVSSRARNSPTSTR